MKRYHYANHDLRMGIKSMDMHAISGDAKGTREFIPRILTHAYSLAVCSGKAPNFIEAQLAELSRHTENSEVLNIVQASFCLSFMTTLHLEFGRTDRDEDFNQKVYNQLTEHLTAAIGYMEDKNYQAVISIFKKVSILAPKI